MSLIALFLILILILVISLTNPRRVFEKQSSPPVFEKQSSPPVFEKQSSLPVFEKQSSPPVFEKSDKLFEYFAPTVIQPLSRTGAGVPLAHPVTPLISQTNSFHIAPPVVLSHVVAPALVNLSSVPGAIPGAVPVSGPVRKLVPPVSPLSPTPIPVLGGSAVIPQILANTGPHSVVAPNVIPAQLSFLQWIRRTPSPHLDAHSSDETTLTPTIQFQRLADRFGAPDVLDPHQYGLAIWDKNSLIRKNSCLERVMIHDYPAKYIHIWLFFPLITMRGTDLTEQILNNLSQLHPHITYDRINQMLMVTGDRYEENLALLIPAVRMLSHQLNFEEAKLLIKDSLATVSGVVSPTLIAQFETELCLTQPRQF